MLRLYNYLTRQVDNFIPLINKKVSMYTCGPTVYNLAHIGNFRTYVFEDTLQRVLEIEGFQIKWVMNITDIEDKIIRNAKEKSQTIKEYVKPFEKAFFEDLDKLNIKKADLYPRATNYIPQMIEYAQVLIDKGLAYVEDGSVYFDISKFPGYGKLSQIDKRQLKAGARVKADEYSKEDVQDFALWKAVEEDEVGYPSPWGKGRPGWHIECSVMSQAELGETIDIHAGAVDLIFPHHENEIAQSEGKTGKKFANFFVEGEHLLVEGRKMSKSLGNVYTLRDIEKKGFDPLSFRYLVLTAHYRDKLNFTWESLSAAQNALSNLREEIRAYDQPGEVDDDIWQKFLQAANSDLGMPQALAVLHEMLHNNKPSSVKSATLLKMDGVLGLKLDQYLGKPLEVPEEVQKLVEEREEARTAKNFQKSDQLRDQIKELGFEVEDTSFGPKIRK